jgi:RNA-directed DNA polymerase
MNSKQNETQPSAQAGWSREAERVAGEVGVLHSSVDLWESRTHGEPREGTCSKARKRSAGCGDGSRELTAPETVRKLQLTLYRKAKAEPQYRFWSLYGEVLRRDVLQAALVAVAENDGAPGVDGERLETITATAQSREQWLEALREELRSKKYRPSPVRRVWIGKRSGGERPLGIPTVKDRVVQTAVYLVLMPIYEADFHDQSYGFRPKRRAHQAMDAISAAVKTGRVEVLDADLSKFFDMIPHRELLKEVARRVSDGSILALLKGWLRAPIVEENEEGRKKVTPNRQGTPQGGVISPLLANIYLNPLDHRINGSRGQRHRMVRYADDFVVLSPKGQSAQARREIEGWLDSRGLALKRQQNAHGEPDAGKHPLPWVWAQSAAGPQRASIYARGSLWRKLSDTPGEDVPHPQSSHAMARHRGGGGRGQCGAARLEWVLPLRQQRGSVWENALLDQQPLAALAVAQTRLPRRTV